MKTYVLFHNACPDGTTAAAVTLRAVSDAHFIPVNHQEPLPPIEDGSRVYIVDFSYPRDVMEELIARCDVTVLDHHKTAEAALGGLQGVFFDMKECGASLVWRYFNPKYPAPALVAYVRDRDLWIKELPETEAISLALFTLYPCAGTWMSQEEISATLQNYVWLMEQDNTVTDLAEKGKVLLTLQNNLIKQIAANARLAPLPGSEDMAVTCETAVLQSDLCEYLRKQPEWKNQDIFAVTYTKANGNVKYSLRGRPGGTDVSEIAKRYGGGGHAQAAGFEIPA